MLARENANPNSKLYNKLNLDVTATAGHSRGGKLATLVLTSDPKVQTAFLMDPGECSGGQARRRVCGCAGWDVCRRAWVHRPGLALAGGPSVQSASLVHRCGCWGQRDQEGGGHCTPIARLPEHLLTARSCTLAPHHSATMRSVLCLTQWTTPSSPP